MGKQIVLFGAGTTGRVIARDLNAKGTSALCFADNGQSKWGQTMEGIQVLSPEDAKAEYPDATWVCSVVRPERHEIIAQMLRMDVKVDAMWDYVPKRYNLPPKAAEMTVDSLIRDGSSIEFWNDQLDFRANPTSYKQIPQSNIDHIYFEDFISKRDDEHYVDCGAADGDTVEEFVKMEPNFGWITAYEPDPENNQKLSNKIRLFDHISVFSSAVADVEETRRFLMTGDYSAHFTDLPGSHSVHVCRLDDTVPTPPTFIKMDIEGSELEALWGARRIIREHSPVLAICAYHEAEHLWEIPLLIHALNPEYELFLRRYAESTFELVWYAVPRNRVK